MNRVEWTMHGEKTWADKVQKQPNSRCSTTVHSLSSAKLPHLDNIWQ